MLVETSKRIFELTPRDWRENDEVVARSAIGTVLIASKGVRPEGVEPKWRRLLVEVDGDPADPGLRDALFYALGIGRPRG
jgi:hypothetical protein